MNVGDQSVVADFVGRSVPVTGHIWRVSESVNAFLQFYFKPPGTGGTPRLLALARPSPGSRRISAVSRSAQIRGLQHGFAVCKAMLNAALL